MSCDNPGYIWIANGYPINKVNRTFSRENKRSQRPDGMGCIKPCFSDTLSGLLMATRVVGFYVEPHPTWFFLVSHHIG
jgi:hypothetical protein